MINKLTIIGMKKSKKVNIRKVTLAALTFFCFWVAGERIEDWYKINVPIGREGECFNITYPGLKDHYRLRIISNINQEGKSDVAISALNKPNEEWLDEFSYVQMRMLNPRFMECK